MQKKRTIIIALATVAAAGSLVAGAAATGFAAPPTPAAPPASAALTVTAPVQSETVQVTVQPNASQTVLIPVPSDNDFTKIPLVTSSDSNLRMASATYSADRANLILSVMNANPKAPTSGRLNVAGWGSYDVTVQPNPSQLVDVNVPDGYDTRKLPMVTSESPNLRLFSITYGYLDGVQKLVVNIGNPFPGTAVSGSIRIDW
jgi:hypothetical protein